MNRVNPKSISAPELQNWLQSDGLDPQLVDVREDGELEIAPFPVPVVHLPLSTMVLQEGVTLSTAS